MMIASTVVGVKNMSSIKIESWAANTKYCPPAQKWLEQYSNSYNQNTLMPNLYSALNQRERSPYTTPQGLFDLNLYLHTWDSGNKSSSPWSATVQPYCQGEYCTLSDVLIDNRQANFTYVDASNIHFNNTVLYPNDLGCGFLGGFSNNTRHAPFDWSFGRFHNTDFTTETCVFLLNEDEVILPFFAMYNFTKADLTSSNFTTQIGSMMARNATLHFTQFKSAYFWMFDIKDSIGYKTDFYCMQTRALPFTDFRGVTLVEPRFIASTLMYSNFSDANIINGTFQQSAAFNSRLAPSIDPIVWLQDTCFSGSTGLDCFCYNDYHPDQPYCHPSAMLDCQPSYEGIGALPPDQGFSSPPIFCASQAHWAPNARNISTRPVDCYPFNLTSSGCQVNTVPTLGPTPSESPTVSPAIPTHVPTSHGSPPAVSSGLIFTLASGGAILSTVLLGALLYKNRAAIKRYFSREGIGERRALMAEQIELRQLCAQLLEHEHALVFWLKRIEIPQVCHADTRHNAVFPPHVIISILKYSWFDNLDDDRQDLILAEDLATYEQAATTRHFSSSTFFSGVMQQSPSRYQQLLEHQKHCLLSSHQI